MYLYLLLQERIGGFFEILVNLQNYILVVVGFIIALVLLRTGIPDRLASGWEKVSGMQDRELAIGERELKQLMMRKYNLKRKLINSPNRWLI